MPPVPPRLRGRKVSRLVSTYAGTFDPRMFAQLQLWLDSADLGTITSSSGAVSQWNDKSGNAFHVSQGTAGNRPTTGTVTLNGLNAIDFDGNDGLNRTTSAALGQNVTGLTMYAVHRYDTFPALGTVGEVIRITTGANLNTRCIFRTTNNSLLETGGRTLDADAFVTVSSTAQTVATPTIQVGVFDYANRRCFQYVNGVLNGFADPFQTATTTSNTAAQRLGIGNNAQGSNYYDGIICEVLVYHARHNEPEIRAVESYLNRKWAIF